MAVAWQEFSFLMLPVVSRWGYVKGTSVFVVVVVVVVFFFFVFLFVCFCFFFVVVCFGFTMLTATLYWVTCVGFPWFFGTMKDASLLINIFASNHCFSYRNIFQNDVDALSKLDAFYKKLKILYYSDYPIIFKFS